MVKNITSYRELTPQQGRQLLRPGHLSILGAAARVTARSGIDRYHRPPGSPWLFEYISAGSGFVDDGTGEQRLGAGDLYVFGPHSDGRYRPDDREPWTKMFFVVHGQLIDSLAAAYGLAEQQIYHQAPVQRQMQQMLELLQQHGEHVHRDFPVYLQRLISSLCLDRHQTIDAMADYIEARITRPFQLQDMAEYFRCSKNHLLRQFKQLHQCTPYECLLRRRVDQAIWLLTHTSRSAGDIAAELQFSDSKHLSSTLKKRTGRSPRAWRQSV